MGRKDHSTRLTSCPADPHSISIFLSGTMSSTFTCEVILYISQVHSTVLPFSSLPVLFVNQNRVVIAGSIKASNTSETGLRISIAVSAAGASRFLYASSQCKKLFQKLSDVFPCKRVSRMSRWVCQPGAVLYCAGV